MATKPVGQAEAERLLAGLPGPQAELLPGAARPAWKYTGKPGRPKGRPNNATLMKRADLDNLGEASLRQRIETAMCDPIAEAEAMVRRIHGLEPGVKLSEAMRDLVASYSLEIMKIREKARDGIGPFVLKKKPTEVDITEKKTTEVRFVVEDRRQLPAAMQGIVIEAVAEAVGGDKK